MKPKIEAKMWKTFLKFQVGNGLAESISRCSKLNQTSLTLKDLYKFGSNPSPKTLYYSSQFLQKEMPIRFAKQIALIDKLPYGLCLMPSIRKIRKWYADSFCDLYNFKLTSIDQENEFTEKVCEIIERHSKTLIVIGKGVFELKKELENNVFGSNHDLSEFVEIHEALNEFYSKRIGIRILLQHHVQISRQIQEKNNDWVGIIQTKCSPVKIIHEVIEDTKALCDRVHGHSPNVTVHGNEKDTFSYVPSHLYYIVMELLKNSMRATMEFNHGKSKIPNIDIIVSDGDDREDVSIKISDQGGGIPRSSMKKIWSYMYSTGKFDFQTLESMENEPILSGMGYGLPVAKCYAKYFHGNLDIMSIEGYGTDAYLYLQKELNSNQPLD